MISILDKNITDNIVSFDIVIDKERQKRTKITKTIIDNEEYYNFFHCNIIKHIIINLILIE